MCRLTGDDIRIPIRILGRNDEVHLSRGDGETLNEGSIWKGSISRAPRLEGMWHTELQVEPITFQPPQDNLSNRVRNLLRQVCITACASISRLMQGEFR